MGVDNEIFLQEDTRAAMDYEQEDWRVCSESIRLTWAVWRDMFPVV